jgi:GDP-D-mannose dehydratase
MTPQKTALTIDITGRASDPVGVALSRRSLFAPDQCLLQSQRGRSAYKTTGVQYSVRQFIEWTATALGMQLRWEGTGVNEVGYWTNRPDSSLRAQQTPSLRAQRGNPGSIDRHGLQPRDDDNPVNVSVE